MNTMTTLADCKDLAELLAQCEGDEVDPPVLRAVEDHVLSCPVCLAAEAMLADSAARLRTYGGDPVSAEFEHRLVEQLCGRTQPGG